MLAALFATGLSQGLAGATAVREDGPLLVVGGDVRGGGPISFDADALLGLPRQDIKTGTIWTPAPETFSGPALAHVLDAAGAGLGDLRLVAHNDYAVTLPRAEVEPDVPVVALLRNGRRFGLRDKGPLWLMFPFDGSTRYRNELVYARSVWQLARIDVLPGP